MKELYTVVLLFLLKSHRDITQGSAKRLLTAPVSSDNLVQLLKDITTREAEIQRYELLELEKSANEQYLSIRKFLGAYDDQLN